MAKLILTFLTSICSSYECPQKDRKASSVLELMKAMRASSVLELMKAMRLQLMTSLRPSSCSIIIPPPHPCHVSSPTGYQSDHMKRFSEF